MKRWWILLAGLMLAILLLTMPLAFLQGQAPEKAYTVSEVLAGLRHHPSQWVRHTVLIRGRVVVNDCYAQPDCPFRPQLLIDTRVPAQKISLNYPVAYSIPIMAWSLDMRQEFLRHLPFGASLAREWFQPYTRAGVIGTYRVRIYRSRAVYEGVPVRYMVGILNGIG